MAHDDKTVEVNFSEIIRNLNEVDFNDNLPLNYSPAPTIPIATSKPTYNKAIQREIQARIRHDNSVQAFSQIYSTPRGLCGKNKFGNECAVFPLELESCIYVKPHYLYKQKPFYRIKFKGNNSVLDLPEKDFSSPSKLVRALSQHFGLDFNFHQNKGKVQSGIQALLNRKAKDSPHFDLPFYYGWNYNSVYWEYSLANGKTHGSMDLTLDDKAYAPPTSINAPILPSVSVQLTAAVQVAEMMNAFTSPSIRNIIWNLLHVASLYSLLEGLGNRFPLGICIRSDDALVHNALKSLLTWFDDKIIVLSETPSKFLSISTERKDQPLLIQDVDAQIINSKMIESAIQTGNLSRRETSHKLYALPVILSNKKSHLSLSSSLMRLDVPLYELCSQAYQIFENQQSYFQDYLFHFNQFVQKNTEHFQSLLKAYSIRAFEDSSEYALSSECAVALAAIHAIEDLTKLYFDSLHANEVMNKQLKSIFSTDAEASLISILTQTSRRESIASIAEIFASTANQMLQDGLFEIRKHGESNTYDPCPPDKQGIVYIFEGDLCFSKEAYDAIVKLTGYGYYDLLGALKDTHAFSGKPLNTNTPQYKMPGPNTLTKQDNTHVYRFSKEFICLAEKQVTAVAPPIPKAPGECNFSLHVGTSIDGNPIIWNNRNNGHICVTGNTGLGKTYFLKKLIAQLPEQNARCIVFDVESDFSKTGEGSPEVWNNLSLDIVDWESEKIDPIPFCPIIPGETNEKIANRIANTLSSILAMGEAQSPWIKSHILSGLNTGSITCLYDLITQLFNPEKKKIPSLKLEGLVSIAPTDAEPFDWTLDTPGITILKINNGDDTDTLKKLIEMILSTLYYMKKYNQDVSEVPLVFVIDECMLLNWNKNSTAHQIMIRGRKDGMCAWLSSQYIPTSKEAVVWEEADMRIYFQQTSDNAKKISKQLAGTDKKLQKYYCEQLEILERGQFIFKQNRNIQISQIPDANK